MGMVDEVIEFWFGEMDERGIAEDAAVKRWFVKSDDFDREIEERFGQLRIDMRDGEYDAWLQEPRSIVAYIVVLDQFSRNIGRGTPVMYEADGRALAATKLSLRRGDEGEMGIDFRVAVLMPLMHSETLEDQELCVEKFRELSEAYPDVERLALSLDYAIKHRDIVRDWGRFPHRNDILGRETTPEEAAFLETPGSSF